jgi:hypothetical protein
MTNKTSGSSSAKLVYNQVVDHVQLRTRRRSDNFASRAVVGGRRRGVLDRRPRLDAAARSSRMCCHASVSCELLPSVVNESDGRKGFAGSSRSIAGVEGGRRKQGRS